MKVRLEGLLLPLFGLLIGLLVFGGQPRAHALPEYTTRTGESCATCHVNPAGGGPRTVRGALWLEQGRPDRVPELPAAAEAASEETARTDTAAQEPATAQTTSSDLAGGQALYEKLGCAGCHGAVGEGASGPPLDSPAAVQSAEQVIRHGLGSMTAYQAEALSDENLASVLQFLRTLPDADVKWPAGGGLEPARQAESSCGSGSAGTTASQGCGGN